MRSSNGGWHGLAGWGFRGFQETGAWLLADDSASFEAHARPSLAIANLRRSKLRSVPEFPGAEGLSLLLARKARRPAVRCHRCAFQADQACRTARGRRRVPAALGPEPRLGGGDVRCRFADERLTSLERRFRQSGAPEIREASDGQAEADIAGRG